MVFTASDVELLVSRGFVQKFETLALLAQACGIPFSNLKVEVELYNRAVTAAREGRTAGSFTDRLGPPYRPGGRTHGGRALVLCAASGEGFNVQRRIGH